MRWLALALLLIAAAASADQELVGTIFFDTGPRPCDGAVLESIWTNTAPGPMYFLMSRIWHGRDYGVLADYGTEVRKIENNSLMAWFAQDGYDMGGHREQETNLSPNYVVLHPGESMLFWTYCRQFAGPPGGRYQTVVSFWWHG